MPESERDRIYRLAYQVFDEGRTFVEGTNDSTHCENCNGGCPDLCQGWTHRRPATGGLRPCKTDEDRRARLKLEDESRA